MGASSSCPEKKETAGCKVCPPCLNDTCRELEDLQTASIRSLCDTEMKTLLSNQNTELEEWKALASESNTRMLNIQTLLVNATNILAPLEARLLVLQREKARIDQLNDAGGGDSNPGTCFEESTRIEMENVEIEVAEAAPDAYGASVGWDDYIGGDEFF